MPTLNDTRLSGWTRLRSTSPDGYYQRRGPAARNVVTGVSGPADSRDHC